MNRPLRCSLLGWSAWAPGASTADEWRQWARGLHAIGETPDSPAVDFIPPIQRRRLSRLSRLSLAVAYSCAGNHHQLPTVFASRHGETHRTLGLLGDLAQDEALSPMAFSLSVHNTASGLYSIASGNTAPSTAIAAGIDTLPMAIIEAIGQLQRHDEVMVVYAEEPLPSEYNKFASGDELMALALHLGRPRGEHQWQLKTIPTSTEIPNISALSVIRWLCSQQSELFMQGERNGWLWSWV